MPKQTLKAETNDNPAKELQPLRLKSLPAIERIQQINESLLSSKNTTPRFMVESLKNSWP